METTNLFRVAEIELSFTPKVKITNCPKVTSSKDLYAIFISHWDVRKIEIQEHFKMALLQQGRVIGVHLLSIGGKACTVVDPKILFGVALKTSATHVAVCHNHPSGNLKPSQMDIGLTKKLSQAGVLLDMPILDHLIISRDGYYSFSDQGML